MSHSAPSTRETTSLPAKLLNMFVYPRDVFDEVLAAPSQQSVWIIPTVLVCLASLLLVPVSATPEEISAAVNALIDAGHLPASQSASLTTHWIPVSIIAALGSAFAGIIWSAAVLWGISRLFLKAPVSFQKTLEVVGLAGMILVLGTIVTALLILASGDPTARPALSLLAPGLDRGNAIRAALGVFNLFHLWSGMVLAIGASRLTGVSLKEASFWVFGYWIVLRLSLILLG